jgi:hypothetical protein
MFNSALKKRGLGAIALTAGLAIGTAPIALAHGGGGAGHGGASGGGRAADHRVHGGPGGRTGPGGRGAYGYGRFGIDGLGFFGFGLLGYGLFFDALPLYYSTYWWDGSTYYYSNHNFYRWNASVGQYQTVVPPQSLAGQVGTAEQQATDRLECQRWATGESGIDSSSSGNIVSATAYAAGRQHYRRAEAACLKGRGYSVQ